MSSPTTSRPASRYGSPDDAPAGNGITAKIIAVIMVLALIVGVVFLVRYVQNRSTTPVEIAMVSYERQSDDVMRVWVDVTRAEVTEPSYCIVTALNYEMAEVGRREVILPAGGDTTSRIGVDIPTREYSVSGGVYGCSENIPPYMDVDNPVYTF